MNESSLSSRAEKWTMSEMAWQKWTEEFQRPVQSRLIICRVCDKCEQIGSICNAQENAWLTSVIMGKTKKKKNEMHADQTYY